MLRDIFAEHAGLTATGREQTIKLKAAVEVGKTMPVLVPVGMPRWQALTHLERLRSLQKKSALALVDTERLSVLFIQNPTVKQSQAPAEPLPYPYPFQLKNKSKKSELLPPLK